MHGAGPVGVRVRPRHAALDGEVDFERAGAAPEPGEGPGNSARQPVPEDLGDRTGRQVEHRDVRRRQLRRRLDPDAGLDLAAQLAQQRHHRIGDRLRSAFGHRPAVPVAGRDDAHPDGRGHRVVQRPEGMRRNTSEQRPPLVGAEQPGERGRGKHGRRTEPGQHQRMVREPQQGPHDVVAERVEPGGGVAEGAPPPRSVATETGGGLLPPSGAALRRCRRRADAHNRSPASATTGRTDPGRTG